MRKKTRYRFSNNEEIRQYYKKIYANNFQKAS